MESFFGASQRQSENKAPGVRLVQGKIENAEEVLAPAIKAAQDFLFRTRHEDGYWCGELEADTTLESDYILLHTLLGTWDRVPADRMQRCVNYILQYQNEDGGWPIFKGGPSNISASVKAYFALKLAGWSPEHPVMVKARTRILEMGGVTQVNTFTKIYLCFLGQYDYDAVPAIPPEIVLFPNWFWFNIYEISSWSRAILVPLSIGYAKKPFKKIPEEMGIRELFAEPPTRKNVRLPWAKKAVSWRNFFLAIDRFVHWCERIHIRPLRSLALKRAEKWMLERFERSEGLGAIYPSMMNAIIALRCLGYSLDDPLVIRAMDQFENLGIEEDGVADHSEPTFRMQPCKSPVWDTAYALYALGESGVPADDPRMVQTADWLLSKEVRHKGDWAVKVRNVEPGGWYFEFENEFYPDVDD
jgi:squalene-hopene/tetraprenyl-beta-curcumene cyclase